MKRIASLLTACLCAGAASAQDQTPLASLDLNAVEQRDAACRMVFTAQAQTDIQSLVVETVLFDQSGRVTLLTLFDFNALPANKMRVRQFDIPQTQCTELSSVLLNGVDSCEGDGCEGVLHATSRVDAIEVME